MSTTDTWLPLQPVHSVKGETVPHQIKVTRLIEVEVTETYTVNQLPDDWDELTVDEQFDYASLNEKEREDNAEEVQGTLHVYSVEVLA